MNKTWINISLITIKALLLRGKRWAILLSDFSIRLQTWFLFRQSEWFFIHSAIFVVQCSSSNPTLVSCLVRHREVAASIILLCCDPIFALEMELLDNVCGKQRRLKWLSNSKGTKVLLGRKVFFLPRDSFKIILNQRRKLGEQWKIWGRFNLIFKNNNISVKNSWNIAPL